MSANVSIKMHLFLTNVLIGRICRLIIPDAAESASRSILIWTGLGSLIGYPSRIQDLHLIVTGLCCLNKGSGGGSGGRVLDFCSEGPGFKYLTSPQKISSRNLFE